MVIIGTVPGRTVIALGIILCWSVIVITGSQKSFGGVKGKDNRIPVSAQHKPMAASIGILLFNDGSGCTAFCVGRDLALTAGHCFYDLKTKKLRKNLSVTKFRLLNTPRLGPRNHAWIKGDNQKEAVANVTIGSRRASRSISDFETDWAIARLSHPICHDWLPLTSMSTRKLSRASRRGEMTMIGYHGDRLRDGILQSPKCRLRNKKIPSKFRKGLRYKIDLGDATMIHSCDTAKGSSGAPIFVNTKDGYKVVAINAGHVSWKKWRIRRNGKKRIVGRWTENIAVLTGPLQKLVTKLQDDKLLTSEDEIRRLQEQLNRAGLNAGSVDGKAGRRTRSAIRKFEKKNGQAITGLATHKLLLALEASVPR